MIVICPACEQKNRIPANRIAEGPKCGGCLTVIDYFAYPVNISAEEFDQAIKCAPGRVVVDFWSPTCGPCLMVAPELEKFATENPKTLVLKVDTAKFQSLAQRLDIKSVPTFHVYNDGELKKTEVGFIDNAQMKTKFAL